MAVDKRGRKLPKGIRQRGNTFEGRFMYSGTTYTVQGTTITKVQKDMTELKYKLEHGIYVVKDKITLDEWYKTWLEEYKKNRVKIGTYTSYEKYYQSIIKKRLGSRQISEIRGEHIQKLYNDLVKEGYALSSIKVVSAVLNGCLKQAMKNGLIERNPIGLAELPRQTGKKKERIALTKEQQDLFMEYAKESYLYHFFAVMLQTGMRKGHVFRHTFATRAIEAGMPPQVLKTILGHSSLAMTMDLYSHVLPDTKAEEMQKIAIMF